MQDRNLNNDNIFWQSTISGTASLIGTFNGLDAAKHVWFPKPPLPYSLATALVAGVSVYGAKRFYSTVLNGNKDLSAKSEALSQATIAAISAGSSTLVGWTATRYNFDKHSFSTGFTYEMAMRAIKRTVAGTVLVGYGLPILINKARNEYKRFLLFNDARKTSRTLPVEKIKSDASVPRKK